MPTSLKVRFHGSNKHLIETLIKAFQCWITGDIKLKEQYKSKKNQLNSDIKNTEINYYSNELELHKENLRKTWKIIKSIIGKDTTNSNQNITFCINGKSTTNVSKIVN